MESIPLNKLGYVFSQTGSIPLNKLGYVFSFKTCKWSRQHIDGLVQERCNSVANALELCLPYPYPSIWDDSLFNQWKIEMLEYLKKMEIMLKSLLRAITLPNTIALICELSWNWNHSIFISHEHIHQVNRPKMLSKVACIKCQRDPMKTVTNRVI